MILKHNSITRPDCFQAPSYKNNQGLPQLDKLTRALSKLGKLRGTETLIRTKRVINYEQRMTCQFGH